MAEIPTVPLHVVVNQVERAFGGGSVTIWGSWMRPKNYGQFDIDHYTIRVLSSSGIQHMTTECGDCTRTVITVSENSSSLPFITTFTTTIATVNLCGEIGPTNTASYTLGELSHCHYYLQISKYLQLLF